MRKWLFLLIAALLFNVVQANAEEVFYTNNHDRYYHTDPDCDRPSQTHWWSGEPMYFYQREIYKKYPVSEIAAVEFNKTPCPMCVKNFEPVYLGDYLPEWEYDIEPWKLIADERPALTDEKFRDEVYQTKNAFTEYFAEYAEYGTGIVKRKHDYPSCFTSIYQNAQGSYTYMIVDPNEEILNAFEKMFGDGAWIISAKYGWNEMMEAGDQVFQALANLCASHPEWDARVSTAYLYEPDNYMVISILGEDWQLAAAAMEDIAPIFVHFEKGETAELV